MSLTSDEQRLFAQWRARHGESFSADGVVDEDSYLGSNPRLLFVLKEVNDPGGGFDLREFLRTGGRAQTWDNIARWVSGIRALPDEIPWSVLERITPEHRVNALRSIAAVNLKKIPGGHTTDNALLGSAVASDADLIRQQIGLYHPDFTICCGSIVGNALQKVFAIPSTAWQTTLRGIYYARLPWAGVLIYYSHPEARVQAPLLHYPLMDAVREIGNS